MSANVGFELVERMATALSQSGFWSDAKRPTEAMAKILVGQDLGIAATRALSDIHIVKGKPVLGSALLASLVKRSGKYRYTVVEHDERGCTIEFFERLEQAEGGVWEAIGRSSFTIDDAEKARLLGNATWRAYPRNMLFARAISNGVKWHCPDVVGGAVYTEGELEDVVEYAPSVKPIAALPAEERQVTEGHSSPAPAQTKDGEDQEEWKQALSALKSMVQEAFEERTKDAFKAIRAHVGGRSAANLSVDEINRLLDVLIDAVDQGRVDELLDGWHLEHGY